MTQVICKGCGIPFESKTGRLSYHSKSCGQESWRKRNPEKYAEIRKKYFETHKEQIKQKTRDRNFKNPAKTWERKASRTQRMLDRLDSNYF